MDCLPGRARARALAAVCTVLILSAGLATRAAAAQACAASRTQPTWANLAQMRRATLCLLNRERRHYGLRPLHQNRRLAAAARYHTADMLRRRYFAHGSPSGDTVTSRIRRAAYMAPGRQWTVGENLAWGRGTQATPASIMAGWMRSPEHRSNILYRPFREIGIEVAIGLPFVTPDDHSGATFATEFGVLR